MSELIRIDFENGLLKTPTKEYYLCESMSMDFLIRFEQLQLEVAYGNTFSEIYNSLNELEAKLQRALFVDASVILYNLKNSLNPEKLQDKKKNAVLQIAALFLRAKDEPVDVWNEAVINAKIMDWLNSGVDYKDFFLLVMKLVPNLSNAYKELFQTILETEGKIKTQIKDNLIQEKRKLI